MDQIISWEVVTLLTGFLVGFVLYSLLKFRSGGVITIPLLAIYTIKFPLLVPFMLLTAAVCFFLIEFLYREYILYGRRLLYISLTLGIFLTIFFMVIFNINAGWYPLIIPGLMAYNSHREYNSTVNIKKSFLINILLFVLLLIVAYTSLYLI